MVYGGVESTALRLLRGLAARGIQQSIVVVSAQQGEQHEAFTSLEGIPLYLCPYDSARRWRSVGRLKEKFQELQADAVYTYSFGLHLPISIAAWRAGIRNMITSVGGDPTRDGRTYWRCLVAAQLARPFCRGEVGVGCYVSEVTQRKLWLPKSRVGFIYNGMEVEAIRQRAEMARQRRVKDGRWSLLKVSRMDDAKDHETIFQAVTGLCQQKIPVVLKLAGTGPWLEKTIQRVAELGLSEVVEFLGNRTDIPELMGQADVLVHSTFTEGLPTVLPEGLAAGVPIIATDIPPCREALVEGRAGVLVPPKSAGKFKEAIVGLMKDGLRQEEYRRAGWEHVLKHFRIETMVETFIQVLEQPSRSIREVLGGGKVARG